MEITLASILFLLAVAIVESSIVVLVAFAICEHVFGAPMQSDERRRHCSMMYSRVRSGE